MGDYLLLIVSAILVSNIVLARYLGNCPFLGVSQKMDTAVGMGMAVIFVVTLAGMITWVVQYAILDVFAEVGTCFVQSAGHIFAFDYHQLRGIGNSHY
jgi:Na+-translocating ferredoxin:NAD+ oxidoreductase RnfA subunit